MADFFKNLINNAGKATQSAIDKSKELAEITRLNIDSSSAEDSIRQMKQKIGDYVVEHNLLEDVEETRVLFEKIKEEKERIAANNAKIASIQSGSIPAADSANQNANESADKAADEMSN